MEPPTLREWLDYLPTNDATKFYPKLSAEGSYDYYSTNGWKHKDGSPVKDWKHTLRDCGRRWREKNPATYLEYKRLEQTQARAQAPSAPADSGDGW